MLCEVGSGSQAEVTPFKWDICLNPKAGVQRQVRNVRRNIKFAMDNPWKAVPTPRKSLILLNG
jgi:hypothetical protein